LTWLKWWSACLSLLEFKKKKKKDEEKKDDYGQVGREDSSIHGNL
jgi:hypothetical protein